MKPFSRWIFPLILGVVMFNTIRLVTDLPAHNPFWADSVPFHMLALLVSVLMSYGFDFQGRYYMEKVRAKNISVTLEYSILLVFLFLGVNLILYLGDYIGILYLGDKVADYVIADVVCILYFFLYYIIIRNDKLEKEYNQQSLQLEKIKVDQLEIELKFLRAQYHPHFLFNALNTVYFQIDEKNTMPRHTLEMLSNLLRYQLYGGNKKVPIQKEIDYLKTYMNFQRLRMSKRLILNIHISEELKEQKIYPLLFLPLIENAFKYVGGDYHIDLDMSWNKERILFTIFNSKPPYAEKELPRKGIGLENLRRRLTLLYPGKYSLDIEDDPDHFVAKLMIEIESV